MKFSKHVKKQYIFLVFALLFLFFIGQNPYYVNEQQVQTPDVIQTEKVSANELFLNSYKLIKDNYWDKEVSQEQLLHLKKHYQGKIKDEDDAKVAINSMIQALNDPYSKFLDKQEFVELNSAINSKVYGIGINIAPDAGKIVIINVIKGTPADLSGLKAGDMITKVNGQNAQGKSIFQIAGYIKNPKLQTVEIEVLRGNKKIIKQIKKSEIKIKTVFSEILDDEIGYIKITSFITSEGPVEFIDAINKIKDTNALVLDLRGNTGGLFQNAIFVADLFLKNKNIVSVLGRNGHKNVYKTHDNGYVYDKPMVVLVDSESASASEIVSGALKDNKRAFIVGTRTFGKGLVQRVFPMQNGTGMNLTIARYLTPSDIDINKKGIEPDYLVQITKEDRISKNDRQLNYALKMLHGEIERQKLARN